MRWQVWERGVVRGQVQQTGLGLGVGLVRLGKGEGWVCCLAGGSRAMGAACVGMEQGHVLLLMPRQRGLRLVVWPCRACLEVCGVQESV